MALIGNLRKRWVLAAIFCTSLIYFLYNTQFLKYNGRSDGTSLLQMVRNQERTENILRKLKWHSSTREVQSHVEYGDSVENSHCRNSLQGRDIIADEEGYVCSRDDVKPSGCCDAGKTSANRYVCESCLLSNCCSIYEHCVSCCMKPDKRPLLEDIIRQTSNSLQQMVLSTMRDQFDLCLTRCRTSSTSVQHENTYRDPKRKHCFGNAPQFIAG